MKFTFVDLDNETRVAFENEILSLGEINPEVLFTEVEINGVSIPLDDAVQLRELIKEGVTHELKFSLQGIEYAVDASLKQSNQVIEGALGLLVLGGGAGGYYGLKKRKKSKANV